MRMLLNINLIHEIYIQNDLSLSLSLSLSLPPFQVLSEAVASPGRISYVLEAFGPTVLFDVFSYYLFEERSLWCTLHLCFGIDKIHEIIKVGKPNSRAANLPLPHNNS